jgi:deoxycytidylate deaminase
VGSGYNEVPGGEKTCEQEFKKCHRKVLAERIARRLREQGLAEAEAALRIAEFFRKELKMLDHCRALHAEENAIVALARSGGSRATGGWKLYTTTYPCKMCANKIRNLGIGTVVYLEPYPQQEAKSLLAGRDRLFEGVTFWAYFRLYGEDR